MVHPAVLKGPRHHKVENGHITQFPVYTKDGLERTGVKLFVAEGPTPFVGGDILFLGGIPSVTGFEKGASYLFYEENGEEKQDDIPDDTSIVMNVPRLLQLKESGGILNHTGVVEQIEPPANTLFSPNI